LIAGYISYHELQLITGFSDYQLKKILMDGINQYALQVYGCHDRKPSCYKDYLYDFNEVEEWIRLFIY
jgi:hypothetical protein